MSTGQAKSSFSVLIHRTSTLLGNDPKRGGSLETSALTLKGPELKIIWALNTFSVFLWTELAFNTSTDRFGQSR